MAEPLVSVIVPTFNRAHCVTHAVDSALGQTHARVEVIIVDDGSTDATAEVVRARYGRDARVRYFTKANEGVTVARNHGLARATGEYIALLDSDDVWKPWKLSVQLQVMRQFPQVGMVWTDMQAIDPAGKVIHEKYLNKMYGNYRRYSLDEIFDHQQPLAEFAADLPKEIERARVYTGNIYSKMFMGSLVHTSTVLLSRERLETVKGFDETLKRSGEDYDFHFRTTRAGPVALIDAAGIQYQVGMPDRLTHRSYRVLAMQNCLATVLSAYERDRQRLNLPSRAVRMRFGEINAWIGEAMLEDSRRPEARRALARSLRHYPWQPRTARLLALASLPQGVGKSLRQAYRKLKHLKPAGVQAS